MGAMMASAAKCRVDTQATQGNGQEKKNNAQGSHRALLSFQDTPGRSRKGNRPDFRYAPRALEGGAFLLMAVVITSRARLSEGRTASNAEGARSRSAYRQPATLPSTMIGNRANAPGWKAATNAEPS